MSVKFYPLPFSVTLWCADIALQSVKPPNKKKKGPEGRNSTVCSYIYIYRERERESKHTRRRSAVATRTDDLQATDISNLLQAHMNKGDI